MHALLCALLPALVIKTCLCVPDPPAPSSCGHGHDTTPHPASSSQRHSPAQRPDFRDVPLTPAQASFDQMRAASNGVASRSFGRASAVGLHHAAPHHAEAFPCPGPNVRSALRRPRPLLILSPAAPWAPEPPGGIHRQQREPENKKKDHVHSASCVRACLRGRVGCTGPTCQPGGKDASKNDHGARATGRAGQDTPTPHPCRRSLGSLKPRPWRSKTSPHTADDVWSRGRTTQNSDFTVVATPVASSVHPACDAVPSCSVSLGRLPSVRRHHWGVTGRCPRLTVAQRPGTFVVGVRPFPSKP